MRSAGIVRPPEDSITAENFSCTPASEKPGLRFGCTFIMTATGSMAGSILGSLLHWRYGKRAGKIGAEHCQ